jgi:uncharacterized membrane protein
MMDQINLRALIKEPRGFVRLLQVLFSILAWSTTSGFSTTSTLHIDCPDATPFTVEYKIIYPFDLREVEVSVPYNCTDDTDVVQDSFPIDFSSTAMLYVLVSIISLLYAIGAAICYCFFTARYEANPLALMVDFFLTLLITILWTVITCTWALNVSDLKHYTHPHHFKDSLTVCQDSDANCQPSNPGKWSSLTVSIVCGFTCAVLWLGSTWFIFKETTSTKAAGGHGRMNQQQYQ